MIGTVKFYNEAKGFGFIVPDDGSKDIFVHINSCANEIEELRKDQRVEFDQQPSRRVAGKFEAVNVRPAG